MTAAETGKKNRLAIAERRAGSDRVPAPRTQFPPDPDRAAEAGFTYGEAAPEKPGRQMETPPLAPAAAPPSAAEQKQEVRQQQENRDEARNIDLDRKLRRESERIGPRGDYKE